MAISGVVSRRLPDRGLGRVIEDAWSAEVRSPSKMMAELAGGLRNAGLNIFRHRKGMLFVSPVRLKIFAHERTSVSNSINAILQALSDAPGLNRKQLVEKLSSAGAEQAELERIKLSLASDLRWLASEGYIIEFNDGTLDLPRSKPAAPPAEGKGAAAAETGEAPPAPTETQTPATTQAAPADPAAVAPVENEAPAEAPEAPREEIGLSVEQAVEPVEKAEAPSAEGAGEQVPSPS
jgi:hypothetical protein